VVGLDDFSEEANDAGLGIELAAILALCADELAEEVLIDPAKGDVVHGGGILEGCFEQFLEEGAGEEVVGLGTDTGEFGVVILNRPHGFGDLGADVLFLREVEQEIEPGVRREEEHALGLIGGEFIHATAATGEGAGLFQPDSLQGEPDFGEPEKDGAADGGGVFLRLLSGVGGELVSASQRRFSSATGSVPFSVGAILTMRRVDEGTGYCRDVVIGIGLGDSSPSWSGKVRS